MTRVLVTGAQGQLGSEFMEISGTRAIGHIVKGYGREELDITDAHAVETAIADMKPQYVVNCAAYTAVDRAEEEPEAAYAINHLAVGHLADTCTRHGAVLVHLSTDYVFGGESDTPYGATSPTSPQGVYGMSKWRGELAIQEAQGQALIIRASWVFGPYGHNFVKTMIALGREKEHIRVVADQIGRPTYTGSLADAIWHIIHADYKPNGTEIQHFANKGECSWAQFAQTIMSLAGLNCQVTGITTAEYPTKAKRPAYSVLDTRAWERQFPQLRIPSWQEALRDCLKRLGQLSS
ncbi:MAG: dTDP-4-dehydrorhamnose reductase [Bacteroidetes bacterium]|jgi:dTDP-4-dehydrorhamnose reductase|nr:dTDP-4-dehydrorhamnose reductase [Bacteroidota bacterium]